MGLWEGSLVWRSKRYGALLYLILPLCYQNALFCLANKLTNDREHLLLYWSLCEIRLLCSGVGNVSHFCTKAFESFLNVALLVVSWMLFCWRLKYINGLHLPHTSHTLWVLTMDGGRYSPYWGLRERHTAAEVWWPISLFGCTASTSTASHKILCKTQLNPINRNAWRHETENIRDCS